jgi:hypothetical protein
MSWTSESAVGYISPKPFKNNIEVYFFFNPAVGDIVEKLEK